VITQKYLIGVSLNRYNFLRTTNEIVGL